MREKLKAYHPSVNEKQARKSRKGEALKERKKKGDTTERERMRLKKPFGRMESKEGTEG